MADLCSIIREACRVLQRLWCVVDFSNVYIAYEKDFPMKPLSLIENKRLRHLLLVTKYLEMTCLNDTYL